MTKQKIVNQLNERAIAISDAIMATIKQEITPELFAGLDQDDGEFVWQLATSKLIMDIDMHLLTVMQDKLFEQANETDPTQTHLKPQTADTLPPA